jgi:hypothetical protein
VTALLEILRRDRTAPFVATALCFRKEENVHGRAFGDTSPGSFSMAVRDR